MKKFFLKNSTELETYLSDLTLFTDFTPNNMRSV